MLISWISKLTYKVETMQYFKFRFDWLKLKKKLLISFILKDCDGKCKSGLFDCDNGGNPICIPESFTWTCDAKCLSLDVPCDGKCSEEKEFTIVLDKNGNEICMYQGFVNFQFW